MGETTKTLAQTIVYYPFGAMKNFRLGNDLPVLDEYDTDYQLTTLKAGAVINRGYQYDETGNVTQISNKGALPATTAEALTYSYQNNNNQLTQAINGTNTAYGYNAAGNLITEQKSTTTRTYTYNDHQRLASVTENPTTLGEYTYDVLGRRTKKVAGEIIPPFIKNETRTSGFVFKKKCAVIIVNYKYFRPNSPLERGQGCVNNTQHAWHVFRFQFIPK